MFEKTHNYLRSKSLKISCSEERALEIVRPVVDFTAYILSLTKNSEVPTLESMKSSFKASKISLAKLLAAKLNKFIEPDRLSITNIEVVLGGGPETFVLNSATLAASYSPYAATFTNGKVVIPEVAFNGNTYSVELDMTRSDPMTFVLSKATLLY